MDSSSRGDRLLLATARIGAPKGLGGFLRIHSYSGEFEHILGLEEVFLSAPDSETDRANGAQRAPLRLKVRARDAGDWGASLAFEGYDSPEAARKLTGMEILVPKELASPLKSDEYYIHDLVGLKVVSSGRQVATVAGVLDGGADPLLELRPVSGAPSALVPFRKIFVGEVDLEAGTLELLAEWLLE
ncbi:MAG TPA: ribosome maturation factor RimM [Rectinemataceae bacterium]